MAKCCSNIFLNGLTGTPPVLDGGGDEPVIPSNLYYAQIPYTGFGGSLVAGSYGITNGSDPASLAAFLQSSVIPQSGSGYKTGLTEIFFWILADAEPMDWTFDAAPIFFTDGGAATERCWETATFQLNFGDPTSDWWLRYIDLISASASVEVNTNSYVYDSVNFATYYNTLMVELFGVGASGTLTVTPTTVYMKVSDTYLPPTNVTSTNFVAATQVDNFNNTPCA